MRLLLALAPAVIFLALIYVFPVVRLLAISVFDPGFTLEHYRHLIDVPVYRAVMLNTFEISLEVSIVCLLLAYPTAYVLATAPARLATLLLPCVIVPFFASALVRNYAWIFLLGARGVINATLTRWGIISAPLPLMFNRTGVIIGMVNILCPYMILILLSVMRGIRPELRPAAESLMASPFTAFRRVFLPLSLPGVGASTLLVFVLALAFFITPAMLGGQHDVMMANIIASVTGNLDWGFAGAMITALLAATLFVIALAQVLFGGVGLVAGDPGATLRPIRARRGREASLLWLLDKMLDPLWPFAFPVVAGAVLIFLVVPVLMIIPLSFSSAAFFVFPPPGYSLRWYQNILIAPGWLDSAWHSLEIGLLTTVLALGMAVPAALGISRTSSRVASVLYLWILSPLIMPSIVVAVGVFFVLNAIGLNYTVPGVALGHTILSLPIATVVLIAALRNFDRNLERAAISLGASALRTTLRITLPVLSAAVFTAALFAFLHSFDELLISLFVSGINARTLPKKMWESLQELDPTIAAVSSLLMVFLVGALAVLSLVKRRGQQLDPRAAAARK